MNKVKIRNKQECNIIKRIIEVNSLLNWIQLHSKQNQKYQEPLLKKIIEHFLFTQQL